MKTVVYVDGFNLYYRALKHTPYKWLDISKLCQLLLPKNQIIKIKYFTALVTARPGDPNQPIRQQIYLRALRTIPLLEVILGHFLSHEVMMPLAGSPSSKVRYAKVIKTEEKGSDVNMATHMLHDGYRGFFDVAVLITNDSDLVEPIKIIRNDLNKPVIVLNPYPKKPSYEVRKYASFVKPIRRNVLASSQFPSTLQDTKGGFHKPATW
jgi:hypothetical protein